jgi:hypothetical protein
VSFSHEKIDENSVYNLANRQLYASSGKQSK